MRRRGYARSGSHGRLGAALATRDDGIVGVRVAAADASGAREREQHGRRETHDPAAVVPGCARASTMEEKATPSPRGAPTV
jgi:hypothetical protein